MFNLWEEEFTPLFDDLGSDPMNLDRFSFLHDMRERVDMSFTHFQ